MKHQDDTIAAIVTPIGEGGISVIRLSGSDSLKITERFFHGKTKLSDAQSHTVHFGNLVDESENVLDEVLVTVFKSPTSYTGENVVEICCHGSVFVSNKILETILKGGARFAEPGEFTKRAFLNNKMDLTQAEAVADLIHSRSEMLHQSALKQLKGGTSDKIRLLRDKLLDICSLVELELDFSEEGIQFLERIKTIDTIKQTIKEMEELVSSYEQGKIIRDGVKVVICGEPNVGKSSLLNALLEEERAIVTHISGTTRDTIEESFKLSGIVFRIVDTAGLRETEDVVEKEGIKRSEKEIQDADIILFVRDISTGDSNFPLEEINILFTQEEHQKKTIVINNKIDLLENYPHTINSNNANAVFVSTKKKIGLNELKENLIKLSTKNSLYLQENNLVITNIRHRNLIRSANEYIKKGLDSIVKNMSGDFVAVDLRIALGLLGEITGEVTTEDILNNIFSKFCIGK
ncbi:MAG: tRNA uridine-5-carboxymethylaminomethyl(34) synthesis GTPase MnmE [Ignavibacteriae bacterium]|nr:tRNA uridine-5-carboxymethylaminomethyl(34) synthesis GTPase MnmE [Ignavibacteriota bacterium]